MGYTHYYYVSEQYPKEQFSKVVADFRKVLPEIKKQGIKLGDGHGNGEPVITENEIIFNGKGDLAHETFALFQTLGNIPDWKKETRHGKLIFEFTKTARKPYDLAVTACLIIAKQHLGELIKVSSDGDLMEWNSAVELCQNTLGYGNDFKLDSD